MGAPLFIANLNSFAFDFVVRQKIQGQTLNLFSRNCLVVVGIESIREDLLLVGRERRRTLDGCDDLGAHVRMQRSLESAHFDREIPDYRLRGKTEHLVAINMRIVTQERVARGIDSNLTDCEFGTAANEWIDPGIDNKRTALVVNVRHDEVFPSPTFRKS